MGARILSSGRSSDGSPKLDRTENVTGLPSSTTRLPEPTRNSGDRLPVDTGSRQTLSKLRCEGTCLRSPTESADSSPVEVESLHRPAPEAAQRRALPPSWRTTQGRKGKVPLRRRCANTSLHDIQLCPLPPDSFLDFRLHSTLSYRLVARHLQSYIPLEEEALLLPDTRVDGPRYGGHFIVIPISSSVSSVVAPSNISFISLLLDNNPTSAANQK